MRQKGYTRVVRRTGAAAVAAVALLSVLSGCGAADGPGTAAVSAPADGAEAVNRCLAEAGFPQASQGQLGQRRDDPLWRDEKFIAAFDRCSRQNGMASAPPHEVGDPAVQDAQVVAFVACMRQRGWQLPDPTRTTGPDGRSRLVPPVLPETLDAEKTRALNGDVQACGTQSGVGMGDGGASHGVATPPIPGGG